MLGLHDTNRFYSEIINYIARAGGSYRQWYVGIATDPRSRLFVDHNVDERHDAWVYVDCGSHTQARAVESQLLHLGCSGGDGGGSVTTRFVYAYRMTSGSRP